MSRIIFREQVTAPGTPASGQTTLFMDGNGDLSWIDDGGNLTKIVTSGASTVTFPTGSNTIATLAGTQTFTGTNTFNQNIVLTNGIGIDFSDTPDGSGTVSSELLDDYEEGTWTPVLTNVTNNATMSVNNFGRYTKIGRLVQCHAYIETTSLGSVTGAIYLSGWPYSIGSNGGSVPSVGLGLAITANQVLTLRPWSATLMRWSRWSATTGTTEITANEWSADGAVYISVNYEV